MEDKKKIILTILITILLILGIIFGIIGIKNNKRNYELVQITEEEYEYFVLKSNDKTGVINRNGDIIIEPNYDSIVIPNPTKDVFVCKNDKDENTNILNKKSEKILQKYKNVEPIYTEGTISSIPYEKSVLKYQEDGKYGLINYEGKKITNAIYEEIKSVKYKEGEILAKKDGKYGVINNKGAILIKFEYDQIEGDKFFDSENQYKYSGYIAYKTTEEGYRYSYINYKWKLVLDTEYNSIERITTIENKDDQWLIVSKNGQYGVMNKGKKIIDFSYQKIEYNNENEVFLLKRNNKYGIYNKKGEEVLAVKYKEIDFKGIYIYTKFAEEEKYFYADGKEADSNYKNISKVEDTNYYITVNKENLYGIIDNNKNILTSNKYTYIEYLFDDYFVAYDKQSGLGIIDSNDNQKLENKYSSLSKIGNLKLIKGENSSSGITIVDIFSENLNKIASLEEANIEIYENYIELSNEKEIIYITSNGNITTNKDIYKENKILTSIKNGKWGYIDRNGNVVVDYKYDYTTELNNYGYGSINKDGKWGSIDKDGNIIIEPTYELEYEELIPEFIGKYYRIYYGYGQFYYTNK